MDSHGLLRIIGCHLEGSFYYTTIKSMGYSHESTHRIISSNTLAGFTVVRFASSRIEEVGQRNCTNCKNSKNMVVIILIADPRSVSVFYIKILFTITVTNGLLEFVYFAILDWFVIHSDISPIT